MGAPHTRANDWRPAYRRIAVALAAQVGILALALAAGYGIVYFGLRDSWWSVACSCAASALCVLGLHSGPPLARWVSAAYPPGVPRPLS